jgi:hypothetical protein
MNFIPRTNGDGSLSWESKPTPEEIGARIRRELPFHLTKNLTDEQLGQPQVDVSDELLHKLFGPKMDAVVSTAFKRANPLQWRILRYGRAAEKGLTGFPPTKRN